MRRVLISLFLFVSGGASAGEFQKLQNQPRAELVNCQAAGIQDAIDGRRGARANGCESMVVGGLRFFTAVADRYVEEGSSPKRVRTFEIFMSQNETSKLVHLRSETVDVIDAAGDPSRRVLKGLVQLEWGQSASSKQVMVRVTKRSPVTRDSFILKLNEAGDWLENTFEEMEAN